MKKGIIFDMDGTLWDSAENVAISWNIALDKVESICRAMKCTPNDILEFIPEDGE